MNRTYETNGNLALKPVRRSTAASVSQISAYLPRERSELTGEGRTPVEEMLELHGEPLARSRSDERFAAAVLGGAFLFLITLAGLPIF